MIIQVVRGIGGQIEGARWQIRDRAFYVGQEYLMVMNASAIDSSKLVRMASKDLSMMEPQKDDPTPRVGLMFHVSRIRCVQDVEHGVWQDVVFVEANQPRVEELFIELFPFQESSSGGGTNED